MQLLISSKTSRHIRDARWLLHQSPITSYYVNVTSSFNRCRICPLVGQSSTVLPIPSLDRRARIGAEILLALCFGRRKETDVMAYLIQQGAERTWPQSNPPRPHGRQRP